MTKYQNQPKMLQSGNPMFSVNMDSGSRTGMVTPRTILQTNSYRAYNKRGVPTDASNDGVSNNDLLGGLSSSDLIIALEAV